MYVFDSLSLKNHKTARYSTLPTFHQCHDGLWCDLMIIFVIVSIANFFAGIL